MPSGGTLIIETTNVALEESMIAQESMDVQPGNYVRVTVSDTGHGIDDETMKKIFEPFFTTKPAGKGTGLGLATCYGIVKQAGGFIGAKSRPEKGSSFDVYIPSCDDGASAERTSDIVLSRSGNETVLIVEDQDQVRRATARALRDNGYRVLEASNGNEALLVFDQVGRKVDLLLTDVVMPSVSGRELANRMTALAPELKVLFMSGYVDDAVPRGGMSLIPAPLLSKPFTPIELTRKIREILDANVTIVSPG
jgi:CheY-like chemotaxis protein